MTSHVAAAINSASAALSLGCVFYLFAKRPVFEFVGWIGRWRMMVGFNAAMAFWNLTLLAKNLSRITP